MYFQINLKPIDACCIDTMSFYSWLLCQRKKKQTRNFRLCPYFRELSKITFLLLNSWIAKGMVNVKYLFKYLVTHRVPYWWKRGCFMTILGFFYVRWKCYFHMDKGIEMNIPARWVPPSQRESEPDLRVARWVPKEGPDGSGQRWGQMGSGWARWGPCSGARWEQGTDGGLGQIGAGTRWDQGRGQMAVWAMQNARWGGGLGYILWKQYLTIILHV